MCRAVTGAAKGEMQAAKARGVQAVQAGAAVSPARGWAGLPAWQAGTRGSVACGGAEPSLSSRGVDY